MGYTIKAKALTYRIIFGFMAFIMLIWGTANYLMLEGWILPITGLAVGLIIWSEIGIRKIFDLGTWKNVTVSEFLDLASFLEGGLIILGAFFTTPWVASFTNAKVLEFFGSINLTVSTAGFIIALIYMFLVD